jgi:hypothetical protein
MARASFRCWGGAMADTAELVPAVEVSRPRFVAFRWRPRLDITAAELAVALQHLVPELLAMRERDWQAIEPEVRRHFERVP